MGKHVLIAPLNWGLGHASRCLPLIVRHLRSGDEVSIAGDGESLVLLRKHFPNLPVYPLAPLHLRYSRGTSQVGAMLLALPKLLIWAWRDRQALLALDQQQHFDLIISDNRFALWGERSVYITHQLCIPLPKPWQKLEPLLARLHARIIKRYSACWVPDRAEAPGLSGRLGHPNSPLLSVQYIGALSRFEYVQPDANAAHYDVVAVLSGLEPQRSMWEKELIREADADTTHRWLIVRGLMTQPPMRMKRKHVTLAPYVPDSELATALLHAGTIISRSGYSTVMDLDALGLIRKAQEGKVTLRLVPTPGQPEQTYIHQQLNLSCCLNK